MYEKFYEQAESMFKPMSAILSANLEVLDALRIKQTDLINNMVADGVELARELAGNTSADAIYSAQKSYWESVQDKLSANARDSFELLSETQEKVGDMLQESFSWSGWNAPAEEAPAKPQAAKPAAKKAAKPAASRKKPAPKPAVTSPETESAPEPTQTEIITE